MADDRLPYCRSESTLATRSDKVMSRSPAISFSFFQKASSRLTLVLWPAAIMERLTTEDFMINTPLLYESYNRTKKSPCTVAEKKEFWIVAKITQANVLTQNEC